MTDTDLAEPQEANQEVDVLDLLVVGGGPGGTATAFRAVEHGLSVQVIDYDDLMRRIRDYSKDKLILPGFGGGDRMAFPRGGPLISALAFEAIDKDEMCARWKALYQEHGVPTRTGVELTGLEPIAGGRWRAHAWDNRSRTELTYDARFVVLAVGRGVPRRFDIPGDTEGIAFRLDDPSAFVGQPACVVGGGTSAAEAVIALSNAKAAAGDPTAVHWSYRGDCMPRVSRALAEVFFTAYVGNGNIRYHPLSEPSAVVTGADRREYLSVRIDRRELAGRPAETVHLEFPKEQCIACIGEDVPAVLLETLGVPLVTGGPRGRRRAVVNRWLESRRPGVFLVGDLLSQAYLETDDFDADPAGFREVRHRGNIKSALRDAVRVADVIRQKLDGRSDDEIEIALEIGADAEAPARAADPGTAQLTHLGAASAAAAAATDEDADGPPAESLGAGGADLGDLAGGAFLTRILPGSVEAEEYPLAHGAVVTIGRSGCDASFADDTALSPRHASIAWVEDGWLLRDDGGATGLFYELPAGEKREIHTGDLIRCGRQFLRLDISDGGDGEGDRPVLTHFDRQGKEIGRHELAAGTIVLGRQAPDVTLDPDDRTLSRRHLAIGVEDGKVLVKDLKSANGSLLRVKEALRLRAGDRFRAGAQRFRLSVGDDAPAPTPPAATPPPGEAGASTPSTGAPSVEFQGTGRRLVVAPGQTLCEAAEAAGIPINAECHAGICGSDPIRILSGREHLLDAEPDDQECETLEEICERAPGEHRLACRVRVRGPVEVEIL